MGPSESDATYLTAESGDNTHQALYLSGHIDWLRCIYIQGTNECKIKGNMSYEMDIASWASTRGVKSKWYDRMITKTYDVITTYIYIYIYWNAPWAYTRQ